MDDLIARLQGLRPEELDYVMARSSNNSIAKACKEANLSESTVYRWDNRDQLDALAAALRLDRHVEVELKLRDALPEAVQVVIAGLKERKYDTQFKAAVEILDRTLGKPTQKQEVTGKIDGEMVINLSWDIDGDE
jgi:transposase